MANVQPQFDTFHARIKLGRFDGEKTLREKRDIIRNKLRDKLPDVFKTHGETYPAPVFRDQGSYDLGTGTKPLDGADYDIDQGVYFPVSTETYRDPVVLKQRVYEALDGHTDEVCVRTPCVTVFYHQEGEYVYHVDLAVYSDGPQNADGKARLARGRTYSTEEHRVWELSDVQNLADMIFARFGNANDSDQFRRMVRYLKRWRDVNFSSGGNAAPVGIGLTVAASDSFQPHYRDITAGTPDDLAALHALVGAMLGRFTWIWDDDGKFVRRLAAHLPVEPRDDPFARMTTGQMEAFEGKLEVLRDALNAAARAVDPIEACETLHSVFGDDFPVPPKEETAKRHIRAISSSSSSA